MLPNYMRAMKKHGSRARLKQTLDMLKRYDAHAQRAIPDLEKVANYFENDEEDFPKKFSFEKAQHVREAIREIKQLKNKPKLINFNRSLRAEASRNLPY